MGQKQWSALQQDSIAGEPSAAGDAHFCPLRCTIYNTRLQLLVTCEPSAFAPPASANLTLLFVF